MNKLGLGPITYDKRDLLAADYWDLKKLPTPPTSYGYENLISGPWQMFGNNLYGCCVPAGMGHQQMLLQAEGQESYSYDTDAILKNYTAMTGFDPNDPSTDNGTDMRAAYKYWRKSGFVDALGTMHKIDGWVLLEPGNLQELKVALYLFGTVGVGYEWPESAFDQFDAGKPFTPVAGAQSVGMHYICETGYSGLGHDVCWGRLCLRTDSFYKQKCRMAAVPFSKEMLIKGVSISGFGALELSQDLARI